MYAPLDLIRDITDAPTLDAKYKVFSGFMEAEYGYVGVNYGLFLDTRSLHAIHNNHVSKRSGLPNEWREIYQRNNYALDDYGMRMGALTRKPILQSSFYRALDANELPENFARVVGGVRNFVSSGVVIPLQANGMRGIIGLFDPSGDILKHDARFERDRTTIQTLANYLHMCSDWSDDIIVQMGLSEMNLKVLRLKAQGLRMKEILYEIQRDNPKTIHSHMQRVRRALGTRNDMETVQRAAKLGLLKEDSFPVHQVSPQLYDALGLR
ncbi:transcriptional regulator, LuxR family (plasmid) [Ruegeria sp. TM1040]|jgi:DNA-binding CsgD family transcriptional regulator|uniref:autoinducer binding domain-containing protein n=1 Tax=Ruegeria sp. (strain TM1040) TaxID=292414 RepID=UPI0000555DF1|nr:autoinducer binding domain-containing protein [Ruegeria sp. TM1040]ABF61940.1 transcriptional regulator, LuxR family [Ruegeria sp. TM1040]